jgi:hypothetical protein
MQVQVKNRLAAIRPGIRHQAIPTLRNSLLLSQLGCGQEEMAQKNPVFSRSFVERDNVFVWNNQHVQGRLRVNIPKSRDVLVLIQRRPADLSSNNFTEDAILAHGFSS